MEGHTIEEAAILLRQSADFLRRKILFAGQAHPILKPCVFLPEPRSLRIINSDSKINEYGVDYVKKTVPVPCTDGRTRGCSYNSANIQGLFELTFFPDYFDMTEAKESGYIQLYKEKAVFAGILADFSIDMAVGWIMNGWKDFDEIHNRWYAMTTSEASSTKSRIRSKIGQFIILSQNGIHYLVDSPASISLSDICITDKMLVEYAASEGIKLSLPPIVPAAIVDQTAMQATVNYSLQEILPIRFIEFYTGGKLGPECTALLFAHKQGIDWNRQMEAEDKLTAYHWQHGKPIALKRTEWESVLISIQSLSDRYNKTERHFDEWRTAALKLLPVAYVRRSEFDAAYRRAMSSDRITFIDQSRDFKRLTGDEDKEARQTIDTPYIPPELVGIVFEGFGHYTSALPPQSEPKLRHKISKGEWKSKRKSAIQLAVEAFLDDTPKGNKVGFYAFLKKQLNLQKEEPFKDGQPYAYYFKDVKEKGNLEGVYLQHPKEGKKEGNPSWNHYAGNEISSIISKERGRRKKAGI